MVQLKQIESATEEEKQTAKDWQQVEEIIRGNPYREAVKQEMYKTVSYTHLTLPTSGLV